MLHLEFVLLSSALQLLERCQRCAAAHWALLLSCLRLRLRLLSLCMRLCHSPRSWHRLLLLLHSLPSCCFC
jgi:hypothetical protein